MNKQRRKTKANEKPVGFSKTNYLLFGLAFISLVVGYILLSIGPAEGHISLTAAPIVLVLAYCILIPAAIMWHRKSGTQQS